MLHVRTPILSTMLYARIFIAALSFVAFGIVAANPLQDRNVAITCNGCGGCKYSLIVVILIYLLINLMVTSANWGDPYTGLPGHRWGIISHNPYKVIRLRQGL